MERPTVQEKMPLARWLDRDPKGGKCAPRGATPRRVGVSQDAEVEVFQSFDT